MLVVGLVPICAVAKQSRPTTKMDVWGFYVGRFASNPGIMDYLHC